jgi:hypothetical protein
VYHQRTQNIPSHNSNRYSVFAGYPGERRGGAVKD